MMVHAALGLMLLVSDTGPAARPLEQSYVPAPVPDRSLDMPGARAKAQVELVPALTDTRAYVPLGGAYAMSSELARRNPPMTAVGSALAPGLTLRIPLK